MTQEDKELLLRDLCARLPYRVKMHHIADMENNPITLVGIAKTMITLESAAGYETSDIEDYIPYLFPLSSMTEEQKIKCFKGTPLELDKYGDVSVKDDLYGNCQYTDLEIYLEVVDWLNAHHFDYRGLIGKGLAIDCTNLNIY